MNQPERTVDPAAELLAAPIEREVKLEADASFRFPDLSGLPGGTDIVSAPTQQLTATYFDTPDLRLARAGVTLRQRSEAQEGEQRELWTLKLPTSADGVALVRHEITWPGTLDQPPSEAIRLVRAITLGAGVHPVARLTTTRRRLVVRDPTGPFLAEIADDEVATTSPDGIDLIGGPRRHMAEQFREIEVELAPGVPASLTQAILHRLTEAGAAAGSQIPKLFRALGPALEPPEVVVPKLDRASPAAEMVRASIAGAFVTLTAHEPGLRLGGDIEHVHKARVATRRLRSDLRTFRPLLDPEWTALAREELKWAGAALGAARDLDVLHDRLRAQSAELGLEDEEDRRGVDQLLERISAQRSAAGTALVETLDSDRYLNLLTTLRDAALDPPLLGADGEARARYVVPALVHTAWKRTRKAVRALGDPPTDPELHELRKRAKALRYGAEAATPFVGKPAAKLASRAKALQDVLGELQDAVVARAWLKERVGTMGAEEALVAGQLIEHQRVLAEQMRAAWPDAWRKLRRKKLRAWLA